MVSLWNSSSIPRSDTEISAQSRDHLTLLYKSGWVVPRCWSCSGVEFALTKYSSHVRDVSLLKTRENSQLWLLSSTPHKKKIYTIFVVRLSLIHTQTHTYSGAHILWWISPLSRREIEILQRMCDGLLSHALQNLLCNGEKSMLMKCEIGLSCISRDLLNISTS